MHRDVDSDGGGGVKDSVYGQTQVVERRRNQ